MTHRRFRFRFASPARACLLALVLVLAPAAFGQKLTPPPDAKSQVDKIFSRFNRPDSPGCAVGATIDGATVLSAAYGMADLEHNIPLTPNSIFEPGSVTKQFTAAAVLLLAQEGKLSLDDPIRKYLPELPDYGTPITIRHLLHHTSGLRDWGNVASLGGWPRTTRANSNINVLDIMSRQKALNYTPGADYSYTNTGFNLLAIIVGRVAGESLPEFSREKIFVPLGMTSTQWRDDFDRIVPNRAIAYTQRGGTTRMLMPFEDAYGNAGLLTTVGDLLRWNRNFTEMKVGGRAFIEAQQQQGRLNDGRTIAYADGLMILHWKGLHEVSHSGSTAGYHAWLGRYPDQGLSVALLCNTASANSMRLGHAVADVYLASVLPRQPSDPPAQPDPATLEAKTGLYRSVRDNETLSVVLKNGQLRIEGRGVLTPVSGDAFEVGEDGPRAEFQTDPSGKVVRLHMATELDEGNYYERVQPDKPTLADLEGMTGEYVSDEAQVTLKVALEQNRLVIYRRPDAFAPLSPASEGVLSQNEFDRAGRILLTPTYRDGFQSSIGSVRFIRDSSGHVTEMSVGQQRMWDLRLRRIPSESAPSR